ncbi:MAG: FtsX-like permease family protein [Aquihabitans sp.]
MKGLVAESLRIAVSSRIQSALVAVMCMIVPLLVIGVAGLGVDAQEALLGRLDSVGARVIVVTSAGGQSTIPLEAIGRLEALSHVAWVAGLGPVTDVHLAGHGPGPSAPSRLFVGGRAPVSFGGNTPGAYVSRDSAARLGVTGVYGSLRPGELPIVGWFSAESPLQELRAFVLLRPTVDPSDSMVLLDRVFVATEDAAYVSAVRTAIPGVIGTSAAANAQIEENGALQAARAAVLDEIVHQSRVFVMAALAALVILSGSVVFMGTLVARKDFGRRRALGASRLQLTILVIFTTAWASLLGAVVGAVAGWAYLATQLGHLPDPRFAIAIAWLTAVITIGAAALPALIAASRDPLRVLRVP